jgi:membrane-associated phospholipid phosphatase
MVGPLKTPVYKLQLILVAHARRDARIQRVSPSCRVGAPELGNPLSGPYGLGPVANSLYYDPGPFVLEHFAPLIAHIADSGFLSDHTLVGSAFAAVGMYWDGRFGLALWVIAAVVAVARVYVGLHHPVHVVGGMLISVTAVSIWRAATAFF